MTAYTVFVDAARANGRNVIERGDNRARIQCPSHDDHNPSLEIAPRRDGKGIVVTCHAKCDHRDVLAALGLQARDLFDDATMRAAYNCRTTYTYSDGRRVHRKPDKTFPQSGNTKGKALFQVEQIGDACLVYVPEGEKDCLAITAAGGIAVCSAMGAGKAHLADWSPLSGIDVVIIADKDAPAAPTPARSPRGWPGSPHRCASRRPLSARTPPTTSPPDSAYTNCCRST